MDSISSSTLTAIGQSADVGTPLSTAGNTHKAASSVSTNNPDLVEISAMPSISQAEQGQGSNPTQFQAVLSDAVRELKVAAAQTSDPFEVAYFLDLAGKFQQLQETGGSGGSGGDGGSPKASGVAAAAG